MTRMVSGLKLNATIRVSKIPNSRAPDPVGTLQGTDIFRVIFRGFVSSAGASQASGKVQLDALQIKFGQGNEKEVGRVAVIRRLSLFPSRLFPPACGHRWAKLGVFLNKSQALYAKVKSH